MKTRVLFVFSCALLLLAGCFTPAPVAPGQDAVVVNAERVQETSLEYFHQLDEWELANRSVLPAEVSRVVDKVRDDFPTLWNESRIALNAYKEKRGVSLEAMNRVTSALSAAQASMLRLRSNDAQSISSLTESLLRLSTSIQQLSN